MLKNLSKNDLSSISGGVEKSTHSKEQSLKFVVFAFPGIAGDIFVYADDSFSAIFSFTNNSERLSVCRELFTRYGLVPEELCGPSYSSPEEIFARLKF